MHWTVLKLLTPNVWAIFLYPPDIMPDTNGKLIYQRQIICVSGMFKAIRNNGDRCEVRKQVFQLVTATF